MKASNTIYGMLADKLITVPDYQRAYSWEIPEGNSKRRSQVDVFLTDLEKHLKSGSESKYYFGHFLFEKLDDNRFNIIDGQQRLTTILILLVNIFNKLKQRTLRDDELSLYEAVIKSKYTKRFETVTIDRMIFSDYIIDGYQGELREVSTLSAQRLIDAFNYVNSYLKNKDFNFCEKMLSLVVESSCTTHLVEDKAEAIQMFIFQNDRGKKPTNLDIIKADFMHYVCLDGKAHATTINNDLQSKFESIFRSIAKLEKYLDEDTILKYTKQVYFNTLWQDNSLDILREKMNASGIDFILSFVSCLERTFRDLTYFFLESQSKDFEQHALVMLKKFDIAMPFIVKSYRYGISEAHRSRLCKALRTIILRDRIIPTRADLTSRMNEAYQDFNEKNPNLERIEARIEELKNADNSSRWRIAYWNNNSLSKALDSGFSHSLARYLLWLYEIHLERQGNTGYEWTRFTDIKLPEVEHIAPQKEPDLKPHGYDDYDQEFNNVYLNSIGNYLLLSKSHNSSLGNQVFSEKLRRYQDNRQQREVAEFVENGCWTKASIAKRKEKILAFLKTEL